MTASTEHLDPVHNPVVGRLNDAAVRHGAPTPAVREVVLLDVDDARALLDLIADLCPEHRSCAACGDLACEPCTIGDPTGGCIHFPGTWYCPACRLGMCQHCAGEVA